MICLLLWYLWLRQPPCRRRRRAPVDRTKPYMLRFPWGSLP